MRRASVPILMYHEVTPRPTLAFRRWTVTAAELREQMEWLASERYTAITTDRLLDARQDRATLPPRPVVITFDDGFRGCVEYGMPILQQYGFTATFYLVGGAIGDTSRWLVAELGIELPVADWREARALLDAGFTCGAHTMSHPRLTRVSPETCREELFRSREVLEQALGVPVRHLAYPFGSYNADVRAVAEECGYRTACSTRPGLSGPNDDPLALRRITVAGGESLKNFVMRTRFGHTPAELLRNGLDRARRRLYTAGRWTRP
ncbi:MAG: polysaccharide deacetylase family protein [Acidobacteria bacterium]|nr:polysaccharide deacetylase family protein [Acidobacteriota bacterium]